MKCLHVGMWIRDSEYSRRLADYLMIHENERIRLHIYSDPEGLEEALSRGERFDALLVMEVTEEEALTLLEKAKKGKRTGRLPLFSLEEDTEDISPAVDGGEKVRILLDKYQDIGTLVRQILQEAGREEEKKQKPGSRGKSRLLGIYSLTQAEYQLPLVLTMADILAEKETVLLVDLQEDSGLGTLQEGNPTCNLEDVLAMAESRRFTAERLRQAIGRHEAVDYFYPVADPEVISEISRGSLEGLIHFLQEEMGYGTILISFGSRFPGAMELMESCRRLLLAEGKADPGWRKEQFYREFERKGMEGMTEKILTIPLPRAALGSSPAQETRDLLLRIAEEWKNGEPGRLLRKALQEAAYEG